MDKHFFYYFLILYLGLQNIKKNFSSNVNSIIDLMHYLQPRW